MLEFQKIIEQFAGTENVKFRNLKRTFYAGPDEIFHEIETTDGLHYIYEVDYVGDLNEHVRKPIIKAIGSITKLYEIKVEQSFADNSPVKVAFTYVRPDDWATIGAYANDKYNTFSYNFSFLVKK
jgi:hypothetical protein